MPFSSLRFLMVAMLLLPGGRVVCAQRKVEASEQPSVVSVVNSPPADAKVEAEPEEPTPQHFELPAKHHAWGRFQPGAWRELQITTETFDQQGDEVTWNVTSLQEILKSVTADSYAFDVQATVDLVGKRVVGSWQTRVRHLATDGSGQIIESRQVGAENLTINGRDIACELWELNYREDSQSLVDRVYYSPEVYPFVLRRETLHYADPSQPAQQPKILRKTTTVALSVPYTFQEKLISCCIVRSVRQSGKGSTVDVALLNEALPGGELIVWTTETNAADSLVRWSEQRLLEYGLSPRAEAISPESSSEVSSGSSGAESQPRRRRLLRPNRPRR